MSLFGSNHDEVWVKGTDDTWMTDSKTVLTLRADGTYTKQFNARVSAGLIGSAYFNSGQNVHSGTYKRSGSVVHLSGDGTYGPYTENLSLFRKVSSTASAPSPQFRASAHHQPQHLQQPSSLGWSLFKMAIEAAPAVAQILEQQAEARDKILASEEPSLRQSHATAFAQSISRAVASDLTLDEDETLPELLKQLWKGEEAENARNAVLKLAMHSQTPGLSDSQWRESAAVLFGELSQCNGTQPLLQWLRGVQIRIECHPCAPSATTRRQEYASAATNQSDLKSVEQKIVSLRSDIEKSRLEIEGIQDHLEKLKQACSVDEKRLSGLFAGVPNSIEGKLRQLFVRDRESWRNLLITPNAPARKLTNSRRSHNMPQLEEIIALVDLTIFGSAKEAVVFSTSAVYFKIVDDPYSIPYERLSTYTFRKGQDSRVFASGPERPAEFEIRGTYSEPSVWKLLSAVQAMFLQQ